MLVSDVNSKDVPRLCIAAAVRDVFSRTFIKAHIERIVPHPLVLFGLPLPWQNADSRPLWEVHSVRGAPFRIQERLKVGKPQQTAAFRSLLRYHLRRNAVEVVLAEFGQTGAKLAPICKQARIPFVVHFHGRDAYRHEDLCEYRDDYARMFRIADCLVACSADMASRLVELGAPPERVVCNPYGVDTSIFANANPEQAQPIFLAVGRFVEKKAPYLTILSFAQHLKSHPESRLWMVGDGPLLEICRQMVRALGIANAVTLFGHRSHSEVVNFIGEARAFVQHSIVASDGDAEGTPVSVLEAQGAGLPVIATRHKGIGEAVKHGETGFLVEEHDVGGMAKWMDYLAKDAVAAGNCGRAAKVHIKNHYEMTDSIARLRRLLKAVADGDDLHLHK